MKGIMGNQKLTELKLKPPKSFSISSFDPENQTSWPPTFLKGNMHDQS